MKYILTGGGTGGHIYPALSIIKEIKERDPDSQILYIGTKDSLEEELVKEAGIDFKTVRVRGLPRRINIDSFKTAFKLLQGLLDARRIIKDFKPDVVIGTGGYVSFPVVFMAQLYKINTYIQEQNAFPGKANKILGKKAKRVFIAFDDAKDRIDNPNIINTGNPIDESFEKLDKYNSREELDLDVDEKIVLSFGGSGGQESINEAILEMIKENYSRNYKIIHISGKVHYEDMINELKSYDLPLDNVEILDYTYNMPLLMSSADLVILSSSAISLAEIKALGKASILIPKSYTADNHQVYNAKSFEKENNSVVILEKDLNGKVLHDSIESFINKDIIETYTPNTGAKKIVDELFRDIGM